LAGHWTGFDNVRLEGEFIPEPSSLLLILIGSLGIGLLRRRRRGRG
ncbi:MAG: PEP-CTERM sorting domain-containing protein, partial [Planctomycetes bacterium]|nr:PEP-CTERM sorting domain-containing protein [Planctomycetota bacterium]